MEDAQVVVGGGAIVIVRMCVCDCVRGPVCVRVCVCARVRVEAGDVEAGDQMDDAQK